MIAYSKTTEERGYTLRTTVKVGTIQGRAERIYREAEMRPRMTRKDCWVLLGMLFGSAAITALVLFGAYEAVSWACNSVLRLFGL